MQVTKKQFKALLKECIMELIDEGAFKSSFKEAITESVQTSSKNSLSGISTFDVMSSLKNNSSSNQTIDNEGIPQYLNEVLIPTKTIYEKSGLSQNVINQQQNQPNARLAALIQHTAAEQAGQNPSKAALMESIFADTAMTTLMNQRDDPESRGISGLLPSETPITQQQASRERQALETLAPSGDISRWAKVAAMSMQSKKN